MRRQQLLYDYFYTKAFKANAPVSVMIELLTQCNLRCKHCYLPAHDCTGINFEKMKNVLYELRDLGVVNVSFTGGEIFLREDLFDLIEITRKLHMRVFLLSNGTLLTNNIVQKLSELHISEFSTTVFSMDEKIHDSITKKPGSLSILLNNLNYLKENKIRVRVKTPLMEKNMKDLLSIKEFCDKNNFEYLASPLIFSKNDGDPTPKGMRIHECDLMYIMKDVDAINRNDHLHANDVPCAALFYSFAIDCKGDVYPCNSFFYKVGNIFESSISQIWYESEPMKFIKSIKNSDLKCCNGCSYQSQCDRCPGMVYLENKDLFSCDKFAKSIAKIRLSNYTQSNS